MGYRRKGLVQLLNPITKRYVLVDKVAARIVSHKRTRGPYKGVLIVRKEGDPATEESKV